MNTQPLTNRNSSFLLHKPRRKDVVYRPEQVDSYQASSRIYLKELDQFASRAQRSGMQRGIAGAAFTTYVTAGTICLMGRMQFPLGIMLAAGLTGAVFAGLNVLVGLTAKAQAEEWFVDFQPQPYLAVAKGEWLNAEGKSVVR